MSNRDAICPFSRCFLYCLAPSSFAAKEVDAKRAYIGSIESFCIEVTYVSNTCARATYAENAFSTVGACIKNASPENTNIEGASRESAYVKDAYAVKYLRIYLQSFSISEIKLFNTG